MILEYIVDAIISRVRLLRAHLDTIVKGPISDEEVNSMLLAAAKANPEKLDWQHSAVDLMKLMHLNSSMDARLKLAAELGYTEKVGTAAMNSWLHRQIMEAVAKRQLEP